MRLAPLLPCSLPHSVSSLDLGLAPELSGNVTWAGVGKWTDRLVTPWRQTDALSASSSRGCRVSELPIATGAANETGGRNRSCPACDLEVWCRSSQITTGPESKTGKPRLALTKKHLSPSNFKSLITWHSKKKKASVTYLVLRLMSRQVCRASTARLICSSVNWWKFLKKV